MNNYYTYAYLREDGTPYYIGKGTRDRIYSKTRSVNLPKDKSRIIFLKQNLTEEDAFKHEIYMIAVFGRKDLGTGILRNKTDGGDGASGAIRSFEFKRKLSESKKGKNNPMYGKSGENSPNYGKSLSEEHKRILSERMKGENNPMYGKPKSEEFKRKLSERMSGENHHFYGKSWPEESRMKQSEKMKGKNNPNYGKSLSEEHKRKLSETKKGSKWWNDGCGNSKLSLECPGEGWVLGRENISKLQKGCRWWNDGCGNTKFTKECPGEGWVLGRIKIFQKQIIINS